MGRKATGFGHNSSRVPNTIRTYSQSLTSGSLLYALASRGFFHMATEFSGFTWTLVFHYQKTELCILSLVPKITRKSLTKSRLIYLSGLGLYTVFREIGDCDCSSSSHFTKLSGQGDKSLWKDATSPWPGRPGWSCGVLVYMCDECLFWELFIKRKNGRKLLLWLDIPSQC